MSDSTPALLLGAEHPDYGVVEVRRVGVASAVALTVGGDPRSPALKHKARIEVPNEDAVLLDEREGRVVLAVADGHHGHEASHGVLERLAEMVAVEVPGNPLDVLGMMQRCTEPDALVDYPAATAFLVGVWDRARGAGFGASFGDCTLAVVGADAAPRGWDEAACNVRNHQFVHPLHPPTLDPRRAREFRIEAQPGQVLVAFTDGVDGCHYGHPETSVQPAHLMGLWREFEGDVAAFVEGAARCALAGVGGAPGGQDNIAIAATRV